MVDLPKVRRRLITTEEPRSSLTRADIASPYGTIAQGMAEVGQGLSDVAEARADDAAARAVQVGADGQITVDRGPLPMVGRAGQRYERAIAVGATAARDSNSDRALIELGQETRGDPAAFRSAAEAYRDRVVAEHTTSFGDAAGMALRRQIDNRITQTYSGLLSQHQTASLQAADHAMVAQITSQADEMETLARRGGIGPDFEDRLGNVRMLLEERVRAPNSTFTREQADQFIDRLNTRVQGAAIHEQMERVYRDRGFEAARDYLRSSTRALDGRVKQLDQIERGGLAWLRAEEAGFRGERDAVSREWATAKPQAATLPRESLVAMRDQAISVGNTRVASDIEAHMFAVDHLAAIRALPPSERAFIAVTGTVPANLTPQQLDVKSKIENEARAQGVDPGTAAAIAWRESRMGANTVAGTSSARGVFQLTQANRDRLGLAPDAPVSDQVHAGIAMVRETTDSLRQSLGREPTAAEIYMGHFQGAGAAAAIIRANPDVPLKDVLDNARPQYRGPNGETWGDTVIRANPFLARLGTVGAFRDWAGRAMGQEGRVDLTQTRGGLLALQMVKRDMARDLGQEITNLRQTIAREEFPPLDQVVALGDKVHAVGTPDQQREVAELVAIARTGQQFQSLPAAQRQQLVSEADAELRTNGAARFDARLRNALRKSDQDIRTAYSTDAYGAFYRFSRSPAAQPTPAVDFGQPQQAAAVLDLRVKQQAVLREEQGMGPVSALRPGEVEALRGTLASGDAQAVAGVFGALNRLPDDILAATLHDEKVRAGITAATHSTDPAKYNAVMSSLDAWYRRDPVGFTTRFGTEAYHSLATWQDRLRYMSPEEIAEDRRRAADPAAAQQRTRAETHAAELIKAKTPDQVVADLGTAWPLTPGFVARNITGSQGLPPVDGGTRQALMGDYESVFKRRYAETLDRDVANQQTIELLRTKWSRSEVNGGRLMLRAPEQVYPQVDGSHNWMAPQAEAMIAEQMGVPLQSIEPAMAPGMQGMQRRGARNWDYVLVSDAKTEQAAQRYDRGLPVSETNAAPGYLVMIRDNRRTTPQWEPLRDGSGQQLRMTFDPNTPTEASRGRFQQQRLQAIMSRAETEANPFSGAYQRLDTQVAPPQEQSPPEQKKNDLSIIERGLLGALTVAERAGLGGTALKLYNQVIQGGRMEPITENDLPASDQSKLRDLVLHHAQTTGQSSGHIDYKDYAAYTKSRSLADQATNRTLNSDILGGFNYTISGDEIVVTDRYDFNTNTSGVEDNIILHAAAAVLNPRGLAINIGRKRIPDTSGGIDVAIRIPKRAS